MNPLVNSAAPQNLDALRFPLNGARLIEASAGTGKTWTIAALYVRLVIGHGGDAGPIAALMPGQILVMTFTRAATHELAGRIRERLMQAARAFRGEPPELDAKAQPQPDPFLDGLLAEYPDPAQRASAAWRLAMAADAMDDAAVLTIDAWCQRMLREHAFDSGSLWDEELVADDSALFTEAVQDYWREQVYGLPVAAVHSLHALWGGVGDSARDLRPLHGQWPKTAPAAMLGQALQDWLAPLAPLLSDRRSQVDAMAQWLRDQLDIQRDHWNGNTLRTATALGWLRRLQDWVASDWPLQPPALDKGLQALTPAGLIERRKKNAPELLVPEAFAWFERLVRAYQQHPGGPARSVLRRHAGAWVQARLLTLKRRRGQLGFADVQARLHAALHGPQGERLAQAIAQQFPVAMIDEFQDTSPEQYGIFERVYAPGSDAEADHPRTLLLIGDPKQSIYGFRGADIYSYLRARQATAGRHHALSVNRRSTVALVDAVNHSFARADERLPMGAFALGQGEQGLPFVPVQAHGRPERWVAGDTPWPALQLAFDTTPRNKASALRHFAEQCAESIVGWLNDASNGLLGDKGLQRLRPRDVAVLVRSAQEATAVRRALQARGLPSVYLSDKDSVFASDEARDLVHWLQAVASPQDLGLARAALALDLVGLPLAELQRLAHDDDALDTHLQQLQLLHRSWRQLGVLAMLRQSLVALDMPSRWLAQPGGERRLTNVLHLAELLQQASADVDGEAALIRWLQQQRQQAADHNDEQVLRLESDADLIAVVTVHKSKGLEYPVVCLPFATTYRAGDSGRTDAVLLPKADGGRTLVLDPDADALARNDAERLREDLRLLYVAMTRPRYGLWMGFPLIKEGQRKDADTHRSAAGYLIGGTQPLSPEGWADALRQWAQGCTGIALQVADDSSACTRWRGRDASDAALLDAPAYRASFDRRWGIASYSRLTRELQGHAPAGADGLPGQLSPLHSNSPADDEHDTQAPAVPVPTLAGADAPIWHRFKRGPVTGNFLHEQLEWLSAERFALHTDPTLANRLAQRLQHSPYAEQADELSHWLAEVVRTPLPGVGAPLDALHTAQAELEFWLPMAGLDTAAVDALCRQYWLPGVERPALQRSQLHGMLMGFADLVIEHQGRYWVLDYKSNHLGAGDAAYDAPGLARAMAQHRYDVQAAVYLLALHRLLRSRLGARYRPAQHLGGAIYLFVRGIHGPERGGCLLAASPAALDALDALINQTLPTHAQP